MGVQTCFGPLNSKGAWQSEAVIDAHLLSAHAVETDIVGLLGVEQ